MKLTEKELNEFPIGTRIRTDKNLYMKTSEVLWLQLNKKLCNIGVILSEDIIITEIPTYTEYIPPKPILDDKEKEYLSAVIKPWRKKVKCIMKTNGNDYEWIRIYLRRESLVSLPTFKKGTMYKGMELDRDYSLEELGLWLIEE